MSNLLAFENATLGSVRVIMQCEEPWFIAGDVAKALGYSNPSRSVQDHCKYVELLRPTESVGLDLNPRGEFIIPESDVYALIFRSNLPKAEEFRRWVCEEVLPAIRKTGTYSTNNDQSEQKRNIKMPSAAQMKGLNDVLMNICTLATGKDANSKEISAEALDCFYKDNFGISILGYVRDAQERVKKKEEEERRARRARAMEEEDTSGIKSMFEF